MEDLLYFVQYSYLQTGTDPEETILAAFKLFDINATGVVNKDE